MSTALSKPLRAQLETTIRAARDVAEKAGKAALVQLAVGETRAPDYLTESQKVLRRNLRAHGRALGDVKHANETQELKHLVWEVAYEHWHRMLFARFLAENNLLMWEPGAAVSLDDCRDMVDNHPDMAMGAKSHWELAGKLAARMLPQVFKPHSPVFELSFAPEHQRELERLLSQLPPEVFQASDSLGWVYQFWQVKRKDEVNASEVKIGADELPAVTQLFTEPYMVDFLLHNSLGAWWHTRHPGQPCPVAMPYLRTLEDGSPAAGNFEGWPDTLTDFKLLDPSCGSGHFLVAAFLLLVPLRMADEGFSATDAVDAVLAHNLHGLEIDPRCVEIAVFALALAAWRYPDEDGNALGVRPDMPAPRIACCGLKVSARPQDWEALVPDSQPNAALLRQELRLLHSVFAQAPLLGSLLNPSLSIKNDLATSSFETLQTLTEQALSSEQPATLWGTVQDLNDDAWDLAISARGLLEAARLLDARYHLVITNVPYRAGLDLNEYLRTYIEQHFSTGKTNLASTFLLRCLELASTDGGVVNLVLPQDWLVQPSYEALRRDLVTGVRLDYLCRLGPSAFREITGEVVNVMLLGITNRRPLSKNTYLALDCGRQKGYEAKAELLRVEKFHSVSQVNVQKNPGASIFFDELERGTTFLGEHAFSVQGIKSGDDGALTAAEKLAEHQGPWTNVWELYCESFTSFNSIADLLAKLQPPPPKGLFDAPDQLAGYPRANEAGEAALRYALSACSLMSAELARAKVLDAEKEHGSRRDWLWSKMGCAPLVQGLQHLAELATLSKQTPVGATLAQLAVSYQGSGWKVDHAAMHALAAVNSKADTDAIGAALRAIYVPWLEDSAHRLQELVKAEGGLNQPAGAKGATTEAPPLNGVCTVFVDGLRYDVAMQLKAQLAVLGKVTTSAMWTSMPSVTASGKAWASPVAQWVSGKKADEDFQPSVAADGKSLSTHNFRKLLADHGFQVLDKHENGDPSGKAWVECGDLDHYGHAHGLRLARDMETQLAQIVERLTELNEAGWARFRIVTDHGWLLVPGGLPKSELSKFEAETRWGRCAVLKDSSHGTPLTFGWDWCKDVQIAFAPGISNFTAGEVYTHGGLTLQECLVPVLELVAAGSTASTLKVDITKVTWTGLRCKVEVAPVGTGLSVDIRTKAALADSTLVANVRALENGKASLAVEDDANEGTAAFVVVLDGGGNVVQKKPTTVGE